jgi:DNA-binding transcriptional LysR family regulator
MRRRTTVDAAADLGISQPAVSNAIKALEKQLGLVVFERTRRQLLPTEEARRLLREIEPLFGMLRNVEEEVRDLRHARSGRLRMISTPPLGHTVVPHALKRFLKERPKVRVNYDIRRLETVIQSVETGAAEIGFVLGVRHHPGLTVTQLHVGEMVCVTPADHPLAGKEKITPADITSHRLIGLETSLGASVRSAFDTAGVPYMSDVQGGLNGWTQHSSLFWKRWSACNEATTTDILFCGATIRDLGSLAAWGIHEFDRPRL